MNYKLPLYVLIITATLFIGYLYQDVILHPDAFLFENTGDAIKNYFTYTAQSDSGTWIQSSIMNYPYGENFLYLDCHPLMTWILHGLSIPFPGITGYSVGILHMLMMVSLLLSAVFVYLIFCELKINRWWAVVGALGIMMMSPQVFRMTGHLALSYTVFIPLTWYLSIRYFRSARPLGWSVLIAGNVLFWYLIHAYLGMIAVSFVALQMLAAIFLFKNYSYPRKNIWTHFGLQVLIPVFLFWGFITLTDHHTGRTTNPWGFFANNANPETIFLPHHGLLHRWLKGIINFHNQNWDGWAYIGLSSIIILILLIIGWIQRKRKKNSTLTTFTTQITTQPVIRRALPAAVVLLLFAMAVPFNLGLQFLLDWFPVIKKLRGNGRFAWVFYYVMTVTSIYGLHYIYYHSQVIRAPHWMVKGLAILLLFLYIGEGWPYHLDVADSYGRHVNTFSEWHLPSEYRNGLDAIDPADYQALLPLPFYHKGSENFAVEGTEKIYQTSMTLGYHTGLSIWGSFATHTSIPESKKSIQTLSPDYYHKAIQGDIHSDQDVLIAYSKESLNPYERDLLHKARKIFSNELYELYTLPVYRIFESSARERIDAFIQKVERDELYKREEYYVSDSSGLVLHEGFEGSPADYSIAGTGAYQGSLSDRKPLWTAPEGILHQDSMYQLSFWFSNFGENYGQDITNVKVQIREVMDNGDRKILREVRPASSMVINGDWSLVDLEFSPHQTGHAIEVYLRGPWRGKKPYYIDELWLREKGVDVYQILEEEKGKIRGLMQNNQRIFDGILQNKSVY